MLQCIERVEFYEKFFLSQFIEHFPRLGDWCLSHPSLTLLQFVYFSGVSVMAEAFRASGNMEMDRENITDLEENK
jgi:hypothetical protein